MRSAVGDGIRVGADSVVRGCQSVSNAGSGITIGGQHTTVRDCTINRNTIAGVHITGGTGSLVAANAACDNGVGLWFASGDNTCRENHVQGNTDNYDFAAGNKVEIRLSEIPESIDWPALVTLEGTLTGVAGQHGIDIRSGDVTIDLGGHSLVGVEGSLTGITTTTTEHDGIEIRNGVVRDWGEAGIDIRGPSPFSNSEQRIADIRVLGNGGNGIRTGGRALVTDCIAKDNIGYGIGVGNTSVVERCSAKDNGGHGISIFERSIARTCVAEDNLGSGFSGYQASTFIDCSAGVNREHGFVGYRIIVLNCLALANVENGIDMSDDCVAQHNRCISNTNGIQAVGDGNVIEANLLRGNSAFGVTTNGMGNIVTCNTSVNDATAFQFMGNTVYGPIVNASGGGDLSTMTGGSHPGANIVR
ncbi:MAG: right-handed parallel beta-helix repeat-containing protein [Phycisphaerales bacterium]|nr:right-handed parallel beta-helix repeat-containing protein [Phycisphaerales bacterium]